MNNEDSKDDEEAEIDIEMEDENKQPVNGECEDEIECLKNELNLLNKHYTEHQTEVFFLENQGCLMDYFSWKKISTSQLTRYLNMCALEKMVKKKRKISSKSIPVEPAIAEIPIQIKKEPEPTVDEVDILKIEPVVEFDIHVEEIKTEVLEEHQEFNSNFKKPIAAHEAIVERAKQEAKVMHRIEELRKQGLWSIRRLPKIQEPVRPKVHWDYLLEEMEWLASDFHHEARFKRTGTKKISKMVLRYFQDKEAQENRVEKERIAKLQKLSSKISKMVMEFWNNAGKVVEYKQQSRLDLKRQKALDLHLTFIVDQTEKYSSWLSEGLRGRTSGVNSRATSQCDSITDTTSDTQSNNEDDEFTPTCIDVTDDEETIDNEEDLVSDEEDELEALRAESELPIEDIIRDIKEKATVEAMEAVISDVDDIGDCNTTAMDDHINTDVPDTSSDSKDGEKSKDLQDDDVDIEGEDVNIVDSDNNAFVVQTKAIEERPSHNSAKKVDEEFTFSDTEVESVDDERTMKAEEKLDQGNQENELDDLKNEGEMSIEQLMERYKNTDYDSDFENELGRDSDSCSTDCSMSVDSEEGGAEASNESETEDASESCEESEDNKERNEMGTDCLITDNHKEDNEEDATPVKKRKIDDNEVIGGASSLDEKPELKNISKTAQSIQPTGYTFDTTKVSTPVPFLLRHCLREYQHVGLEWLATLYKRRLNGILADEMGLGKTIQTISLLAHLACEHMVWGPHLIVVPTSVMLNWEMEIKKWCPAFKVLTYYGSLKERRQKRHGWTKANAFHICITSYKLVIQDHQSFRRKKWKYFILDEAQNIKNFRSQRWQILLNFQSQRRLLLTGTPLQNSLMELWSLMHFLMPQIFASHNEFKMWFANPVTGMVDGSTQYNEKLVRRLHKVLRPFLLRRLKKDVEKQMPQKYEHVVMCKLSKRQRYLYDDFMSQTKTKETLASGHFMSVINILMQLRKVCNHPNLFDPRPTISSFQMNDGVAADTNGIAFRTATKIMNVFNETPLDSKKSSVVFPYSFSDLEFNMSSIASHRIKTLKVPKEFILKNRNNWTNVDDLSSFSTEVCGVFDSLDATSEMQLPGNRKNAHKEDDNDEDNDNLEQLDSIMQAQVSKEIEGEYHRLTESDYNLMSEDQLDNVIYLDRDMSLNNTNYSRALLINKEHLEDPETNEHISVSISETRKEDPLFIVIICIVLFAFN